MARNYCYLNLTVTDTTMIGAFVKGALVEVITQCDPLASCLTDSLGHASLPIANCYLEPEPTTWIYPMTLRVSKNEFTTYEETRTMDRETIEWQHKVALTPTGFTANICYDVTSTLLNGNVTLGSIWEGTQEKTPEDVRCFQATPARRYYLASYEWFWYGYPNYYFIPWVIVCSGIILNIDKRFDYLVFNLRMYSRWIHIENISNLKIYTSNDNILYSLILEINLTRGTTLSCPITLPYSKFIKFVPMINQPLPGHDNNRGYVIIESFSKIVNLTIKALTTQGYPVYKAKINVIDTLTLNILSTTITDENGLTTIETDISFPPIKIWGEKTINKTILNLTAKEISELNNINADEKPNDNIP